MGAIVIMRSGNDSDEDRKLYRKRGAFGSIGKTVQGSSGLSVIQAAIQYVRMHRVQLR